MKIKDRLYNDYLMSNRYDDYEKLLKSFLDNDYQFLMIKESKDKLNNTKKYIYIRHDIDSDIKIARKMFEIEKKLNIKSTFYFRLSTFNKKLVKEILEYGSEVGYHYEEVATFCKLNKNISKEFVELNKNKIQEMFLENIKRIQKEYEFSISSIAAHGDFVNRKLQITNKFLYDSKLNKKLKFIEAYDIEDNLDFRTSDCMYPKFFKENPNQAIKENKRNVLLLVHTRYWDKNPIERFKLDLCRVIESIRFR